MCSVWPTAVMLCCARIPVIHHCISSRSDASGLSVSASITAPWPWNTRAIWSGSGSADMPTTTGCSDRCRPSPGMHGFPYTSQGVGSTKEQSTYGQQARVVRSPHLYPAEPRTAPDCLQRPLVRRSRFRQQLSASVIAPRKAWRLLQGESPCRVRASHPPVSSLASMAES